jgi:hypothetical protein
MKIEVKFNISVLNSMSIFIGIAKNKFLTFYLTEHILRSNEATAKIFLG